MGRGRRRRASPRPHRPRAVWKTGETPTFILDLRDQGNKTANARAVPYDCQIEVDGVWYSYEIPSGPYPSVGDLLEPGKQVDDWATVATDEHWTSLTKERTHFPLKAGKHTIRIAYSLTGEKGYIRPVGGPVEIVVSKESAWGDASGGVQARLSHVEIGMGCEGNAHIQPRPGSRRPANAARLSHPLDCEIEVDGSWYLYGGPIDTKAIDAPLEPASRSTTG